MEYVDYNLEDDTSIFNQILSGGADEILCAASYWYAQTFRNISLPLTLHNGLKLQIFSTRTEYTFRRKESGRSIKCEAYGEPLPRIYFKHNGFELVWTSKGNHSILDFDINETIERTYFCIASNTFGTVQKKMHVFLNDGDGEIEYLDEDGLIPLDSLTIEEFLATVENISQEDSLVEELEHTEEEKEKENSLLRNSNRNKRLVE